MTTATTDSDELDGALFRFWIRFASSHPGRVAVALAECTSAQEYRQALLKLAEEYGVNLPSPIEERTRVHTILRNMADGGSVTMGHGYVSKQDRDREIDRLKQEYPQDDFIREYVIIQPASA